MSYHHHHLLLVFLLYAHLTITTTALKWEKTNITKCPSVDCGNGVKISYPFWVSNSTSNNSYCGYPGLEVTCKDKTPTFRTFSDNYTITDVNTDNRIVSLTDTDVLDKPCPRVKHQVNLTNTPNLGYASSVTNLTFFFNCPTFSQLKPNLAPCLEPLAGDSYVFIGPVSSETYDMLSKDCDGGVVVSPVLADNTDRGNVVRMFPKALQGGFKLTWKEPETAECRDCEGSDGYCGYQNKTGKGSEFACFCPNGSVKPRDCNVQADVRAAGKNFSKSKKIIIGFGVGVGLCCIIATGLFLFFRHKKIKKRSSSSVRSLVYSTSSNPSLVKDPESISGHYLTPIFSYEDLQEATNNFDTSRELGDGGFGTVYKGKLKDGRIVAVKRLYENNFRRVEQFLNEVVILNRLRHHNLVSLYGCTSRHSRELLLVYEFVSNGTVADHLHGSRAAERALKWPLRMNIAIETAGALAYLHAVEPQIIHRDVKTNNILLDDSFHVKVADFGLSRLFPLDATHVSTAPQGTPGYLDPEYHECYQLTDKSDVYSFGVVLIELISSKTAIDITRCRHEINLSHMAMKKIANGLLPELVDPTLGFDADPEVRRTVEQVAEVAFRCLQGDGEMRPSMIEVCDILKSIARGDEKNEKKDDSDKHMGDEKCLLDPRMPDSPDTVTMNWKSSTTTNSSA